ncbi:MAG: hypothetical protein ACRDHV_07060 [Actinomycetota bacterium]
MTDRARSEPRAGMPRWVKVFLVIGALLAAAFLITRLAGVQHGPGLHTPAGGEHTPPVEHNP